jgi:hypothetical protein
VPDTWESLSKISLIVRGFPAQASLRSRCKSVWIPLGDPPCASAKHLQPLAPRAMATHCLRKRTCPCSRPAINCVCSRFWPSPRSRGARAEALVGSAGRMLLALGGRPRWRSQGCSVAGCTGREVGAALPRACPPLRERVLVRSSDIPGLAWIRGTLSRESPEAGCRSALGRDRDGGRAQGRSYKMRRLKVTGVRCKNLPTCCLTHEGLVFGVTVDQIDSLLRASPPMEA